MSRKAILRIEVLSCLTTSILLGVWLILSVQQWMKGNFTILWALLTVIFAAAIIFDAHRISKRLSFDVGQPRTGMLVRLIGTIFVSVVVGVTLMQGFANWLLGNQIFWAQVVSTLGLLLLAIIAWQKILIKYSPTSPASSSLQSSS
jgi:hypothetical protein